VNAWYCSDSKISQDYNIKGKKGTDDILALDEMSSLRNQFFSSTMDEYRSVNFETFERLIQDTDKVILMDTLLHKVGYDKNLKTWWNNVCNKYMKTSTQQFEPVLSLRELKKKTLMCSVQDSS